MVNIIKGQKVSLEGLKTFNLGINWNQASYPDYDIDASILLLSENGKLEEEENFIFYNHHISKCSSVILSTNSSNAYKKNIEVNLDKTPDDISRLIFVLTIDNGDTLNQRFGNIENIQVDLVDNQNSTFYQYFLAPLSNETALILMEIYRNKGEWKLQATGNGFNAGLDKILEQYGSDKVNVTEESATIHPIQNIEIKKESEDSTSKESTINLTKITLEKKGDVVKINLSKAKKIEEIHLKLLW